MNFEEQIREASQVGLFLDFDGTLAPIVPRPSEAVLPPGTREALMVLAQQPKYAIAFVSGRSIVDLEQKAAIAGAVYAGNHGLEIRGPGLEFSFPEDPLLRTVVERLRVALQPIPHIEIEDKTLSASIHFRRVAVSEWPRVEEIVRSTVAAGLKLRAGKMVFDLLPAVTWNKGSAVKWIVGQLHLETACLVYLGDDLTDEDAFAVLPGGITIQVGPNRDTVAKYRLQNTSEVEQLLQRLAHG